MADHGTYLRYNLGCRCDQCREAKREKLKEERERRIANTPSEEIPHGIGGYVHYACRCEVCIAAASAAPANTRASYRAQAESVAGAKKRGQEWTGPELEIAARKDLTAKQVAEMLGRTVNGVRNIRHSLKRDPKLQILAGLPVDEQSESDS